MRQVGAPRLYRVPGWRMAGILERAGDDRRGEGLAVGAPARIPTAYARKLALASVLRYRAFMQAKLTQEERQARRLSHGSEPIQLARRGSSAQNRPGAQSPGEFAFGVPPMLVPDLRPELGRSRERDRARAGPVERRVDHRDEVRRDAEPAHQRRGVPQPVGEVAARRAGLGDRFDAAAARTKGPGVPLLAVGPGPQAVLRTGSCPHACAARLGRTGARAPGVARAVPVVANGDGDPTDTAGSERVKVACSGAGPGAAVPGDIGRRALRIVRIADAGVQPGAAPPRLGGGPPRSAIEVVRAA